MTPAMKVGSLSELYRLFIYVNFIIAYHGPAAFR